MPASSSENATETPRADEAYVTCQEPKVLRVGSAASLLAAVPVLLGFQPPEPCLVVIGTVPPRSRVALTLRYDIDGTGYRELARHAASLLGAQEIREACVVGYGPGRLVTPAADALRARFSKAGITVREALRVQDGRYWSYACADPECCPPDGTEFDLAAHPITRRYAHLVLASREALAARVAPVTGDAADSMRKATTAARRRAGRLAGGAGKDGGRRRGLLQPGLQAVTDALRLYRAGGRFESHDDAAWLALVLQSLRVRDDAWARMDPAHVKDHLRLWTDLTALARPGYAAAPASLLAFTAWQDGDGALANVALDRALADDPDYSMARLLRDALDAGAPPSMARLPMTPEEVSACYDQAERPGKAEKEAGTGQPGGDTSPDGEDSRRAPGGGAGDGTADPAAALAGTPA
jgi:hypothetical protein